VFQGKLTSFINEENSGKNFSKNKESFGCVILNVKDRDVMNAWTNSWKTNIKDFKISDTSEDRYSVTKREFISKAPEMLIFQINRVEYTEKFEMIKVNSLFDFEEELFIDQFLEQNSETVLQNELEYLRIEDELSKLHLQLETIDNYYGENRSLLGKDFN
jgi:hypothetical protein